MSTPHVEHPTDHKGILRWIGTNNPFYAVSAALVLAGLWLSFGKQNDAVETTLLMSGLAAYTLLLAATALVLVRHLKLWDDARTVMLLVVLLFLATSATFDHVLVVEPLRGSICCLLGLALAMLVSEALLRALPLHLPALYRLPYHAMLALFFVYPIFVRFLLDPAYPVREPVMWGLFGFSSAAGLVVLTLLPALRRGPEYVRDNGSPWSWPLYPWSLFVVLAFAVAGRAVLMCWSLHSLDAANADRLVFGPFFLVPFGFAIGVLVLEMGVLTSPRLLRFALMVPVAMIGLALIGHAPEDPIYRLLRVLTVPLGKFGAFGEVRHEPDPIYAEFLRMFSERLGGDPLFITLVLAIAFYSYAALRRVPWAAEAASVGLGGLAFVATNSLDEGWLTPPVPVPLLIAGALLMALGLWRQHAWTALLSAACLAGAATLVLPTGTMAPEWRSAVFVHGVVLAMLVIGAAYPNHAGMVIRRTGIVVILFLVLAVMHDWLPSMRGFAPWATITYPVLMGIMLAVYAHFLRDSFAMISAAAILGYWLFKFGWIAYRAVRVRLGGLDFLVSGLAFFVVAVLVSLGKSGVLMRWIDRHCPWMRPTLGRRGQPAPIGETPQPES